MRLKMRKSPYILYTIALLFIMATALMTACSSGDNESQTTPSDKASSKGHTVQLVSYANNYVEQISERRAAPSGFSPYTPDKPTNMGVYMLLPENWTNPKEQLFKYVTTSWTANIDVDAQKDYTVYGYMPKTEGMSSSLTKSTADGATLTISGINAITSDDVCVITGVKNTDEGLKEGSFLWRWEDSASEPYYIYLLMDHLFAAVQFHLKIDEEYAQLRTIKLKTMTLSTNKQSSSVTVTLTHNETGVSPISSVDYGLSDGSGAPVVIFSSDDGTALDKTEALVVDAYFPPSLSESLTLASTYDVYDRKGNLIRQNCSAINKLPNLEVARGQRAQLSLTVKPTYLYVLSDPDLDNPTISIEN